MKKILLIATALTISISSFSQKKEVDSKIIIAGSLKNYKAKEVMISNIYNQLITSSIEGGDFKFILDAEESEIYYLKVMTLDAMNSDSEYLLQHKERSRFEFFLKPGDSIFLSSDFLKFNENFIVKGDNTKENNYLFEKNRLFFESIRGKLFERSGGDMETALMGLEKEQYFYKKDSLFNAFRNKFEALKAGNSLDPEFIKLEEAYLKYHPIFLDQGYILRYAIINGLIDKTTGKYNKDDIDFPEDKVKADLANVDLNRSELLYSRSYKYLIQNIIIDTGEEIIKKDNNLKTDQARMIAIDQLISSQKIKDLHKYFLIKKNLEYRGPVYAKTIYEKFMNEQQSPQLAAKLQAIHDTWNTISPGKEVPDFSFVDIEGNSVKLSGLQGTLVYIDIWATWCGPCIAEHPHWDKLREEYKDKAVSFLAISLDTNKEAWEKMVKAKNMEGLHWFAADAFKSELARHFMVNGIPRFLLLDRNGKIIDPSADRPSGDIRATLDQHL